MDEKLNEDGVQSGRRSIRTLIALDAGMFESNEECSNSSGQNLNLQSCCNDDVREACGIKDIASAPTPTPGDVSFSSYLISAEDLCARRSSSGSQVDIGRNSVEGGAWAFPIGSCRWVEIDNNKPISMERVESQRGIGISKPKHKVGPIHGDKSQSMGLNRPIPMRLDRQGSSFGQRVAVVGRHTKDGEIGVFDADRYFNSSMHGEEKSAPQLGLSSSRREEKSRHSNNSSIRPQFARGGVVSDRDVGGPTISRQPSSVASSMGSKTIQSDSQTSWNSQSGLLSNRVTSLLSGPPLNQRLGTGPKNGTPKWRIACKCPCSNKKSVATNDSLLQNQTARINFSVPNSLQSSHRSSPLRPICSGISLNNLDSMSRRSYFLEKNTDFPIHKDTDLANRILSLRAGIQKDEQLEMKPHAKPNIGKPLIEIRPTTKARAEDGIPVFNNKSHQGEGFSFPILGSSSMSSVVFSFPKEKPRLSLQVIGTQGRNSRDYLKDSQKQSPNTQRRPRMHSLDSKADNNSATETRSSFSFPRISFCSQDSFDDKDLGFNKNAAGGHTYHAMKLDNRNKNTNAVEDDRSDSSSDLFEIESLSADILPSCTQHRRTSSGRTQLKECSQDSTLNTPEHGIGSRASERGSSFTTSVDWSTGSRANHFMANAEMARRSEGYITRSTIKDNPRDLSKKTRNTMVLEQCRNDTVVHLDSAPGSPTRGTQQ